jgi:5-methylcytosine-specific restriction endonuclease McrA
VNAEEKKARQKAASYKHYWSHVDELKAKNKLRNIKRRDKNITYCANYYLEHKEKMLLDSLAWKSEHKEEVKDYWAKWYREHADYLRIKSHMQRVYRRDAPGWDYITLSLLESRWEFYGRKCWVCGAPAEATDHVKPLNKGGGQWPCNLRPICKSCNSSKKDKWPYDYESRRKLLKEKVDGSFQSYTAN